MKQIQKRGSERQLVPLMINDSLIPQYTGFALVKKVEKTTTVTRERTTYTIAPVCGACGEVQARVIGAYFECVNAECPGHDPKGGAAIPLPAEGKTIIDVDPIKEAA